jgi:hypothetical protein
MRKTGERRERQPVQVLDEGCGLRQPAQEEERRLRQPALEEGSRLRQPALEEGSRLRQPALEEGSRLRQLTVRDEEGRPGPAPQQTMAMAPGPRANDKENRMPSSWPAPRPSSGPGEAGKENIQLSSWRRSLRPQGKAIRLKRVDLEKGTTGPGTATSRTISTTPLKLRDMNRI